jgi:hypothetical protein
VAKGGEEVTLPFDEGGEHEAGSALPTDDTLARAPSNTAAATMAQVAGRVADYAQAWGVSIPADCSPATKAQVAYWRELCGAITLTGADGMGIVTGPRVLLPRNQR